jgi:hypothetical protein
LGRFFFLNHSFLYTLHFLFVLLGLRVGSEWLQTTDLINYKKGDGDVTSLNAFAGGRGEREMGLFFGYGCEKRRQPGYKAVGGVK